MVSGDKSSLTIILNVLIALFACEATVFCPITKPNAPCNLFPTSLLSETSIPDPLRLGS